MRNLLLTASLAVVLTACGGNEAELAKTIPVNTANLSTIVVQAQTIPQQVVLDGTIEAINKATVSAQTSGQVTVLPFDVGDYVTPGATIVRLTDTEQKAGLQAAQAGLEAAQAGLAEAKAQFARIEQVFAQGVVSQAQFDQVKAGLDAAQAAVIAGRAKVKQAEQQLAYTNVVAPYAGILVRRLVDVGATVAPGTPLLEGVSLTQLRVAVEVPQQFMAALRQYRQAQIILPGGTVVTPDNLRIPPVAQIGSQSFQVLAEFSNPSEQHLFPGTLVKIALQTGQAEHLTVPANALSQRGEMTGLYVLDGQQVKFRYVRSDNQVDASTAIVHAGLQTGDVVITNPTEAVKLYKAQQYQLSEE